MVTASGTATVQTALHGKPMVVVYKLSPVTYRLGKRMARVDTYAMVNLIAGQRVVRELIQDACTPEAIADEAVRLLTEQDYRCAHDRVTGRSAAPARRTGRQRSRRRRGARCHTLVDLTAAAVTFDNVSASRGGRRVLHELSLSVGAHETVALVGRSGSGKTTLLRLVNRLIEPDAGRCSSKIARSASGIRSSCAGGPAT